MSNDPNQERFFSYLSLFTFSMLILVAASNFVQLFLGWEGVGLCSYLLIGFWYKKDKANKAAIKASELPTDKARREYPLPPIVLYAIRRFILSCIIAPKAPI